MRDNHNNMPELIEAFEKEGLYFACLELERGEEKSRFQFGVSKASYLCLQEVLAFRPFDKIPGIKYRCFFVPSYSRFDENLMWMTIRIEQGNQGKQFEFKAPDDLVANLKWFTELQDLSEAGHLLTNISEKSS